MNSFVGQIALVGWVLTAVSYFPTATASAAVPLNDLGTGLYLGQFEGGLYPNGSNEMPSAHEAAGLARASAIRPLDGLGEDDPFGSYAMVSIGMSNTTQEFCSPGPSPAGCDSWTFMGQAEVHPAVNQSGLAIVNGAAGGQNTATWDSPSDANYTRVLEQVLTPNGLSELQVQVAWVKLASPRPTTALPASGAEAFLELQRLGNVMRALKDRYPNLQQVYLSSRIYAGYATTMLNPEPYAYESAFVVKWLIEAQINQMNNGSVDPLAGNLDYESGVAPWLAWGPYMWADGLNPRSDGLTWAPSDFSADGTHPAQSGEEKVGTMLLDFMLRSPTTKPWFLGSTGDFDLDGDVDRADLDQWQSAYGISTTADADGDGLSSGSDLLIWQQQFGTGVNPAGGILPVPEPTSFTLLLIGTLTMQVGGLAQGNGKKGSA